MPSKAIVNRCAASLGSSPPQVFSPDPTLPARASANANPANANPSNARSAQNNRNTRDARNNRAIQNNQNLVDAGSQLAIPDAAEAGNLKLTKWGVGAKQVRAGAAFGLGKSAASSSSRLKLELLGLSIEREPQLKLFSQLLSAPFTNLQEQSAAAALWRAIALQPPDILRDF